MIACAIASNVLVPVARGNSGFDLDATVPRSFGDWNIDSSVIPVAPSPDVQANLDRIYDQMVSRTYRNSRGDRIMLVVAYGGDQSDSFKAHRQEVCYQAQGFTIRTVRGGQLSLEENEVPLVRMHAVKGRRSEPVSYWFTMGDRVAIGRVERLFTQVWYGLQGKIPDGMLVRVSNISEDLPSSYDLHDAFLRDLLSAVGSQERNRLAGLPASRS
jgi:EpsI family protein